MNDQQTPAVTPDLGKPRQGIGGKLFYTLTMFVVFVGIFAGVIYAFTKTMSRTPMIVGIPVLLVYAIICFTVKKGFRMWLLWWGFLALGSCALWVYLILHK